MSETITMGAVSLAESTDSVSDIAIDGAQVGQAQAALRAAAVKVRNRGQRAVTVTFTRTHAPHASAIAARTFLFTHEIELRDITATTCDFTFGTSEYTLSDAVLTSHRAVQIGLTTRHTYTLTGGTLAATPA